jgi:hypothetical protein
VASKFTASRSILRGASSFQPKLASGTTSPGGDILVVIDDAAGLHIKTLDQLLAEVQAEFAKHVPRGVLLSEEILADRRSEIERD